MLQKLSPRFGALIPALCITFLGIITLYTFQGDNGFFYKQLANLGVALLAFTVASVPDYRFLRSGYSIFTLFLITFALLAGTLFFGEVALGAQMSYYIGPFSVQPVEIAKVVLILVLAKYFSRRHELIGSLRHIFVSGMYAALLFSITLLQGDFGSGMILGTIWLGMVLVAGINLRHLLLVFGSAAVGFALLWNFVFLPYQKDRIYSFLDPLADIQGAGYNAYQATIATGSGELLGKGVGYGTQSKLQYLPEHETDFIFASFTEEWGFVGGMIIFTLFGAIILWLIRAALRAESNFERLTAVGVAVFFVAQFTTHVGMNIGLLPITGLPLPFMSFGGSHLLAEYLALGLVVGMTKHREIALEMKEVDGIADFT